MSPGSRQLITYRDGSGQTSTREISDWHHDPDHGDDAIDAFCHLRGSRRSFLIRRITRVCDPDTGEIDSNPWRLFGIANLPDGKERLESALYDLTLAIQVLMSFTLHFRAINAREKLHLLSFIRQGASCTHYSDDQLLAFIKAQYYQLPGSDDELLLVAQRIPPNVRQACRNTALQLVRGSGRKPIPIDSPSLIKLLF